MLAAAGVAAAQIDTGIIEKHRADLEKQSKDPVMKRDGGTQPADWAYELPAGVTGAPITYMFEGKQYIVAAISARKHPGEFVAFSLP